ncbi:hypothetical protein DFJ58DRAFT_853189 [Suillus subalutaceus]|uniref:uncharacterized protein n=1 Tax=Suillus subalutaceus TaxID=48586 RepID=UPI001B8785BF|nr:uncharacterized protein DFJ58DRAFT_853189 [Suillus subalutaceus]KAG1844199.1 hypothetical protein DFJ58DRAFT_853189 [Suillus subalutaceus]
MSLDDDRSSTLTLLYDYGFNRDLVTIMIDTGPDSETNDELKHRAKSILSEMGSTITSVGPHGLRTSDLLDAMMEGSQAAGLSSGVRYSAAAIIAAYQKGEASNSSASELIKLAHDWFLFFLWPCMLSSLFASHCSESSESEFTPTPRASEVSADTVLATSRGSKFRNLISERDDKCVVTRTLNIHKGPYPPGTKGHEGLLNATHILPRSVVHEHSGSNVTRVAATIDIIKHFTKLPENILDNLSGVIDNPENGMLLDMTMHDTFNSYMWCLHSTDILHKYKVHWFRPVPMGMGNFTEVQFQDNSQTDIQHPDPTFIALRSALAHILHLSGAADVINKVHEAFFDEGSTVPFENCASQEDFLIRLSLIELMTTKHQLATNPHGTQGH